MRKIVVLTLIGLLGLLQSCKFYSFTGAEVHPDLKTFSVYRVINQASTVNPDLSINLQDELVTRLNRQTTLQEQRRGGGLEYHIVVQKYTIQPTSISSGAVASENRFQVGIKCTFKNAKDEKMNFEQSFTSTRNFPSTMTLQDAESQYLEEIVKELIDKVFNESLVNW